MPIPSVLKTVNRWQHRFTGISFGKLWQGFHQNFYYTRLLAVLGYFSKEKDQVIIVSGTARSGTTWLAELLQSSFSSVVLWEMIGAHIRKADDAFKLPLTPLTAAPASTALLKSLDDHLRLKRIKFEYLYAFYYSYEALRYSDRVIAKCIFANPVLSVLSQEYKSLFLLRHPCAVVASELNVVSGRLDDFRTELFRPDVRAYFDPLKELINSCREDFEIFTLHWCMSNYCVLCKGPPYAWLLVVYERLCLQPDQEYRKILSYLEIESSVSSRIPDFGKSSISTVGQARDDGPQRRIGKWKESLTQSQSDRILAIAHAFGFTCYSDNVEPCYEALDQMISGAPLKLS